MKVFTNLNELIKRLYTERKLLCELFQARQKFDFRYEDALALADNEKNLQLLIDYGIVRLEGEMLELEEAYQQFFEDILRLNDNITSSAVAESLRQLERHVDFYLNERNNPDAQKKYVHKIRRTLRNIATQTASKTIELKRAINDTYRQERNYATKRQKIEDYQTTLENIASLIRQTEELLEKKKEVLSLMTNDNRITKLVTETRLQFRDVFHSLIDLRLIIRDYIHQIEAHNRLVKRIRKLKYLKDQLTWERATDLCDKMAECNHQLLENNTYFSTKVSIPYLRDTDGGNELIAIAHKSVAQRRTVKKITQIPLDENDMAARYVIEDYVDTDVIANAFFASSQNLYSFVVGYPYPQQKDLDQMLEYYAEIILNHYDKLLITDEWHTDGNVDYPLIYNKP